MQQDIRSLVSQGLYQQNLTQLIELCDARFDRNPALYGTLHYIFRALAEEYDDQAIPQERYELIMHSLERPILRLLEAEEAPAEDFLDRLCAVLRGFRGVVG